MPSEITNMATEVLLNVSLGVLTLLGALATLYIQKGIKKLQAETAKIKDDSSRDFLYDALDRLDDVAAKTVNKIEQTTKKQIQAGIAAGTVSPEKMKELAHEAFNEIIKTLEPDYLLAINETMGDSETYIMNLIEEKLELIKSRKSNAALAGASLGAQEPNSYAPGIQPSDTHSLDSDALGTQPPDTQDSDAYGLNPSTSGNAPDEAPLTPEINGQG